MGTPVTGVEKIRKALELQLGGVAPAARPLERDTQIPAERQAPVMDLPRAAPARSPSPRRVPLDVVRLRGNRVVLPGDVGPAAETYRMLRTQVLQALCQNGFNSLAIVSPTADDGRTVTAVNLAISIADDADHTAMLVDLDLKRPGVHDVLGFPVERGVDACLRDGTLDAAELLVQPDGLRKLVVLPAARPVAGSAELLAADSTRRTTREFNARYTNRIVLYDLPPLLEAADGLAFLRCVDAVLLVVREGCTRREDIVRTLRLMRDTPVVGTVLNGSREPRVG